MSLARDVPISFEGRTNYDNSVFWSASFFAAGDNDFEPLKLVEGQIVF
jgi:hypothetical protein